MDEALAVITLLIYADPGKGPRSGPERVDNSEGMEPRDADIHRFAGSVGPVHPGLGDIVVVFRTPVAGCDYEWKL